MDISIKLAVYTATAGIDPDRVIPVVLDGGLCRLVWFLPASRWPVRRSSAPPLVSQLDWLPNQSIICKCD
jgi:hypothetical protein